MKSKKVIDLRLVKLKRQHSAEEAAEAAEYERSEHEAAHARAAGWPPALVKALGDQWDYRAKLATGEIVNFASASYLNADWVRLYGPTGESGDCWYHDPIEGLGAPCPRGVDVKIGAIAWVVDSPHGS